MSSVLTVIGTRPEAIKMAPVIEALRSRAPHLRCVVCSTGQHREMLAQTLSAFGLEPDRDLGVMTPSQTLSELTATLITGLDRVVTELAPRFIVAQGDTTTVLAASLVAFYRHVPFAHVEAGLRTGDRQHPFPEEINRRIADLVGDVFFAPTARARAALLREGCNEADVYVTGNTVIDAVRSIAQRPFDGTAAEIPAGARVVAITAHRRESFGATFREMCLALRELATEFAREQVFFVYPVHLNPNVQRPVRDILADLPNLALIEPLPYVPMINLLKRAEIVLTDSGGIQEECLALNKPVLVMRETTERPEGVEAGGAKLVGTSRARIFAETSLLLRDAAVRAAMAAAENPYGDGTAGARIADILAERLAATP